MSIVDDATAVVETAVPQMRAARWGLYVAGFLLTIGAVVLVVWWLVLRPIEVTRQAEQAKVDGKLGTAAGQVATQAIPAINEATRQKVQIDLSVQKGTIDVRQATDAATSVAGVSAAVVHGNCMLPSLYRADDACKSVPEDRDGIGPAGPDAGSATQSD
jgi:hypothetical protein